MTQKNGHVYAFGPFELNPVEQQLRRNGEIVQLTPKVLAVLEHLAEGCGVRQTARLVGVNKDTATRLARLAGEHAKGTHDEVVAFSPQHPRSPAR